MIDTTVYKGKLEEEKARLETELASIGRHNPSNPADWEARPNETSQEADPNDAADLIEGYETNSAILNDLELRYADVLTALEKISKGTYGICEISGEEIEADRLASNPAAKTCKAHLA